MAAAAQKTPLLIRFFDPASAARDARGRRLQDILSWPDSKLEGSHDYIQMLFPLPEGSIFNPLAPVVTEEVHKAFIERSELKDAHHQAFDRILSFYGLTIDHNSQEGSINITKGPKWSTNSGNWVCRFDHNHLRISRIIRSLRVLGSNKQATALFECLGGLEEVMEEVSKKSLMFWERAAKRPLHLSPDETDEEATGVSWLRDK